MVGNNDCLATNSVLVTIVEDLDTQQTVVLVGMGGLEYCANMKEPVLVWSELSYLKYVSCLVGGH